MKKIRETRALLLAVVQSFRSEEARWRAGASVIRRSPVQLALFDGDGNLVAASRSFLAGYRCGREMVVLNRKGYFSLVTWRSPRLVLQRHNAQDALDVG